MEFRKQKVIWEKVPTFKEKVSVQIQNEMSIVIFISEMGVVSLSSQTKQLVTGIFQHWAQLLLLPL